MPDWDLSYFMRGYARNWYAIERKRPPLAFTLIGVTDKILVVRGSKTGGMAIFRRIKGDMSNAAYGSAGWVEQVKDLWKSKIKKWKWWDNKHPQLEHSLLIHLVQNANIYKNNDAPFKILRDCRKLEFKHVSIVFYPFLSLSTSINISCRITLLQLSCNNRITFSVEQSDRPN